MQHSVVKTRLLTLELDTDEIDMLFEVINHAVATMDYGNDTSSFLVELRNAILAAD